MTSAFQPTGGYTGYTVNPDGSMQEKSELSNSSIGMIDAITVYPANTSADLLRLILMEMRAQTEIMLEGLNVRWDPQAVRIDPTTNPVSTGVAPVYS
jgi:hypothetical protein